MATPEEAGPVDPERLASALMTQKDFSFQALQRLVETIPLANAKKHRDAQGGKGHRIQGMIAGVWAHGSQYGIAINTSIILQELMGVQSGPHFCLREMSRPRFTRIIITQPDRLSER